MTILDRVLGIGYDRAKSMIAGDTAERRRVAGARGVAPEILYYLAGDPEPEVRRAVARNAAAPPQADLQLARDVDDSVRGALAEKVARIVPSLDESERGRASTLILETLEVLARDALPKVRRILAEEIKSSDEVPAQVVETLARDDEIAVSAPVLEFSPLLTEDFLVELIAGGAVGGALAAIARRANLGAPVADAIVARDDEVSITVLLRNASAQIREETLDALVARAEGVTAWHEPLVRRPSLSASAQRRLSEFVADSLIEVLARRDDLDAAVARRLREGVRARLASIEAATPEMEASPIDRARDFASRGELDEATVMRALGAGDRAFVMAALAVMSGMKLEAVHKMVSLQSAKGLVALTWKAGLPTDQAVQLQLRLARIAPSAVFGGAMSEADMRWHLDYFAASA